MPPMRGMLIAAIVAALWTWTAGLGGLYHQEWDHNFRNALLHDLINNSWPVVWEGGADGPIVLDYYLAWSLIPALVGKLLGWRAATLAMAAISCAGVFLVMVIFARIAGSWRWWVPFFVILWSGLDIVGWGMRWVYKGDAPGVGTFIDAWSFPLWFLSHTVNYFCVAHLAVPGWIVILLIAGRRVGPRSVGALSSFLIPLAPFLAIGTAPFVIWGAFQGEGAVMTRLRRALTPENIAMPLVLVMLCAPLYLGNQGLGNGNGWFYEYAPFPTTTTWIKYASFWGLEILIPALAIWACGIRERLLVLTVAVLCLVSIRRAGLSNDLALKASAPGLMILTLYTFRAMIAEGTWRPAKWFLVGVFALGAVSPLQEIYRSTYATLHKSGPLESDVIKTFDPRKEPPEFEARYVPNFHSRPLPELPLLRWMIAKER